MTADDGDSSPGAVAARVDPDGTVWTRDGSEWRVVGQFPDAPPDEAIAYFARKYDDLASEVALLEVRARRSGASPGGLRSAATALSTKLAAPAAVGDVDSLRQRVAALLTSLDSASLEEQETARQNLAAAIAARSALVDEAEALAAADTTSVHWNEVSAAMGALFERWQELQKSGPKLPKATADALWTRFREARGTVEKQRRAFYAELDDTHRKARDVKARLAEQAEALVSQGADGVTAYRSLLEEWKRAGRAGKRADDQLWARFKAAGDALYAARSARDATVAVESAGRIAAREELLARAASIQSETDLVEARRRLTQVQREWDAVGRIYPKEVERALEDRLRAIETALRAREQADWKHNDPRTRARADDMSRQLAEAIQRLEDELADARAAGDTAAQARVEDALQARRQWLRAIGR
jgi:hypothetical protein